MVKNINNKIIISLIIAFSTSCSLSNLSNINTVNKNKSQVEIKNSSSNESIVDLKNLSNKNTGLSFKVKINSKSFNTKLLPVSPARSIDIKSYKVWLCTDPAEPVTTAVTPTDISINRDGQSLSFPHTVTFMNVPQPSGSELLVTYYAVAQALDSSGNILTENNNGNVTPYSFGDMGAPVAVSDNSIQVDLSNVILSSNTTFNINMNLSSSKPASLDFKVDNGAINRKDVSVGINNSGSGFIVWSEDESGTYNIFAQPVKGFNKVGVPVKVNSTVSSANESPSISINDSGNGVIVWKSLESSVSKIRMTTISNYQITTNSDTLVSSSIYNQEMPHVSINSSNNGVVTWQDYRSTTKFEIYARKIINLNLTDPDFLVNKDITSFDSINPRVFVNSIGNGIIVWTRRNGIFSTSLSNYSAYLTSDQSLITGTKQFSKPAIAIKDDGSGLVVADNDLGKINAKKIVTFSPDISSQFIVSQNITSNKSNPSVVLNSNGNGLVIWDDDRDSVGFTNIYGRKIVSSQLYPLDLRITENKSNGTTLSNPDIVLNDKGNGLVASEGILGVEQGIILRHIINFDGFEGINVSTFAGTVAGSTDGNALESSFTNPEYLAKDSFGNIYISEPSLHRVRKIDIYGLVTTFAGKGTPNFSGDGGSATDAELNEPSGLAVDSLGNVYIADTGNNKIRKVNTSGVITTEIGSTFLSGSIDGFGTLSSISNPKDLAIDSSDNIYFSEVGSSNLIRKYSSNNVSTIVGSTSSASAGDLSTNASSSKLNMPVGIALDEANNYLYIADKMNHKIKRLNMLNNTVEPLIGNVGQGDLDGNISTAKVSFPHDLVVMNDGISSSVFVTDSGNNKIKMLELDQSGAVRHLRTIIGNAGTGIVDDLSHKAKFNFPVGIIQNDIKSILIADSNNHRIRIVTKE